MSENAERSLNKEEFRKYAWDYFEVHAGQRLTTFNFYIVISTVIGTGIMQCLRRDNTFYPGVSVLGIVLTYLSFIFWRLDKRNKKLVENGERALKKLDDSNHDMERTLKLFHSDDEQPKRATKKIAGLKILPYTYSDCFRSVFLLFGLVGIVVSVFTFSQLLSTK